MSALQRQNALDSMDALDLCSSADAALGRLVDILNQETTLLRTGRLFASGDISARKTQAAQDYVALARAVQRESQRLSQFAPDALQKLQSHHASLATQMAENLRVLATAKNVTEDILNDVARSVGATQAPKTYSAAGAMASNPAASARGLAVNRAL